jgi:hypothetical protein
MSIATTTTAPSNMPEYGTPAPRSARPPASSVKIPPAVGRPCLVALRSTMKKAIPIRIRITPIVGDITTIIGRVPFGQAMSSGMTIAS